MKLDCGPRMSEPVHVLVVDDEPRIRAMLRRYLVGEDSRVSDAADGTAMRGVLERDAIDLVLLDLIMPGERGQPLATTLPQIKRRTQPIHSSPSVARHDTAPLPRHSASHADGAGRFGNDCLFGQQCRQAEKCRERVGDDIGGYSGEEGAHTTLVFEAVAKRAGGKARTELRHDAARNVGSTARTERQGEIAGDGPEHGTEHLDGFTAVRFLFTNLRIRDLRGRVGSSRNAVDLSEGVVEIDEARTRQEPFG